MVSKLIRGVDKTVKGARTTLVWTSNKQRDYLKNPGLKIFVLLSNHLRQINSDLRPVKKSSASNKKRQGMEIKSAYFRKFTFPFGSAAVRTGR